MLSKKSKQHFTMQRQHRLMQLCIPLDKSSQPITYNSLWHVEQNHSHVTEANDIEYKYKVEQNSCHSPLLQ